MWLSLSTPQLVTGSIQAIFNGTCIRITAENLRTNNQPYTDFTRAEQPITVGGCHNTLYPISTNYLDCTTHIPCEPGGANGHATSQISRILLETARIGQPIPPSILSVTAYAKIHKHEIGSIYVYERPSSIQRLLSSISSGYQGANGGYQLRLPQDLVRRGQDLERESELILYNPGVQSSLQF